MMTKCCCFNFSQLIIKGKLNVLFCCLIPIWHKLSGKAGCRKSCSLKQNPESCKTLAVCLHQYFHYRTAPLTGQPGSNWASTWNILSTRKVISTASIKWKQKYCSNTNKQLLFQFSEIQCNKAINHYLYVHIFNLGIWRKITKFADSLLNLSENYSYYGSIT